MLLLYLLVRMRHCGGWEKGRGHSRKWSDAESAKTLWIFLTRRPCRTWPIEMGGRRSVRSLKAKGIKSGMQSQCTKASAERERERKVAKTGSLIIMIISCVSSSVETSASGAARGRRRGERNARGNRLAIYGTFCLAQWRRRSPRPPVQQSATSVESRGLLRKKQRWEPFFTTRYLVLIVMHGASQGWRFFAIC